MRNLLDSRGLALLLLSTLLAAGCTDQQRVTGPADGGTGVRPPVAALQCRADVAAGSLTCAQAGAAGMAGRPNVIVGSQGVLVLMVSTNVHYDNQTQVFSADVQVGNVGITQQLGTPDGSQTTGVRVFFHTGPNVADGTGTVTVKNPDGTGTFTGSDQPYFFYNFVLPQGYITPAKSWQWNVPNTVNTFSFSVLVQADVPGENGFARITPATALLDPSNTVGLTGSTFDAVGQPTSHSVTFSSSNPSVATVNPSTGLVTAVSGGRAVITATTGGPETNGTAVITVNQSGYQIELRYLTSITQAQQTAFENARARYQAIVTADVASFPFNSQLFPVCGDGPVNEIVDDIVINVILGPIDGVGNILGQAGPCAFRSGSLLPAYGIMMFDTADLASLQTNNQLGDVILHEMGHVLGIGSLWSLRNLLLDTGVVPPDCNTPALTDPYFTGAQAAIAFNAAGGTLYSGNKVPVETLGGPGTRCGHWRDAVFSTELMTGVISAPGTANPMSAISLASMADLGYSVDLTKADAYTLPCAPCMLRGQGGAASMAGTRQLVDDIWQGAVYSIDPQGHMTQVLPDRRPEGLRRLDLYRAP